MIRTLFHRGLQVGTHLSYANVMATTAVFIALGGTTYAATQLNGSQIKDRSISGKKLKLGAVTGQDLARGSVGTRNFSRHAVAPLALRSSQLRISGSSAVPRSRRAGLAQSSPDSKGLVAQSSPSSGGLVRMSVGDTVTVLEAPPFTFTATCVGDPSGTVTLTERVSSTEDGWTDFFLQRQQAGDQVKYFQMSGSEPRFNLLVPAFAVAPDGTTVSTGNTELGVHAFGSDCVLYQYVVT